MRRATLLAVLGLLAFVPLGAARAETPYEKLYHRGARTPDAACRILDGRSLARGAGGILVVLDAATFEPPDRRNEFNLRHHYRPDVPRWLDALDAWAKRRAARATPDSGSATVSRGDGPIHAASTLSSMPVRIGEPGWRERLEKDIRRPWWGTPAFRSFEPATAWMARLLRRVPGSSRMLALVTAEILPERWADHSFSRRGEEIFERWRESLLPIGDYWNEEAIGALCLRAGVVFDVIAPEARFCDFWPIQEIPELPWASRPTYDKVQAGSALRRSTEESLRRLRREFPGFELPEIADDDLPGKRFGSRTPIWHQRFGTYLFFNTDCPSALGYWPYVRAAARTGGSYVFYPHAPSKFLDDCPYDSDLLRRLAPATTSRAGIFRSKQGDSALDALCRASRLVFAATDFMSGAPRPSGWSGYASTRPLKRESRFRERNKPQDFINPGDRISLDQVERYGQKLVDVVRLYDKAIRLLGDAERRIEDEGREVHRRSMANLRLGRFWFEMSGFHLEALSLYCREIRKHIPPGMKESDVGRIDFMYVPTIRMSDCLAGYTGRRMTVKRDRELQRDRDAMDAAERVLPGAVRPRPPTQSNTLPIPERDPDYRALRHPAEVMRKLDPRLKPRALRMIDAGQNVMDHEGRSPWGWMVYYSVADTFVWYAVPVKGITPTERPGEDVPPGDWTPGSRPGGPSTGGK